MKKKIIIFGATGNVGSYLTKYASDFFDRDEYEIIASGRRESTSVFKPMGVEYISVDLTKKEDFVKLPTENIYAVMLLAIVSSLVRNFVPRKKSKNHHAALNRISF